MYENRAPPPPDPMGIFELQGCPGSPLRGKRPGGEALQDRAVRGPQFAAFGLSSSHHSTQTGFLQGPWFKLGTMYLI